MATINAINSSSPIGIASGGTNAATMGTTDGVIYYNGSTLVTTAVGTAAQILTSNGAGSAPTFQTSVAGANTFVTGSGTATQSAGSITIAGGTNISTTGSGSTVTINLASPLSVAAAITAGTGLTSTNDFTVTAGNILLPTTSSTSGQIKWNNVPFIHTYGTHNLFVGESAGNFTTTVTDSCGFGYYAMNGLTTTGVYNDAFGNNSLKLCTTSGYNTAFGYNTLAALTSGSGGNTALGSGALSALGTGDSNIAIGYNAGSAYTTTETSNICIGNVGVITDAHVIRIGTQGTGSGQQSSCFIAGIAGVTVANSAAVLMDTTTGQMGTVASSIRFKENVTDMGDASSAIMKLRPVTFTFKKHPEFGKQYGLIAEEVNDIFPDIVVKNAQGEPETVQYHVLPALLLNELQRQNKLISDLEAQLKNIEEGK